MWQQWINGILGLWLIVLPFLGLEARTFLWTLVISGLAVAVFGFWGALEHEDMAHHRHRHTARVM